MTAELELELRRLQLGSHACLFFDDPADDWGTLVPYFREGLRRGERCEFVAGTDEVHEFERAMKSAGLDVEREVCRGALCLIDLERSVRGHLEPGVVVRSFEERAQQALAEGFTGLRSCGQIPSRLGGESVDERTVLEIDAMLNEVVARGKVVMLCRHDLRSTPPSRIRQTLQVHPIAVIGPLVCPSPFYEPPEMALGHCSDHERVRWLMDRLCRSRAASLALEEAVQVRDEFIAAASHELRTPLTSSQLYMERACRLAEDGADDPRCLPRTLRRAQQEVEKMARVVDQLLDASQMREPALSLNVEPVDVVGLVRETVSAFGDRATRAGCALRLDAPAEPIVGLWDRGRLGQVVTNLLSNAVKFGPGKPVDLKVSRENGTAQLLVRDHGIGVADEDRTRIFERFERAAPVSQYGGFGLGLWIVRKIVGAFGGNVVASNAPDAGAVFTVALPLDRGRTTSISPA
jgi:two-component sensor histidine kinase